MSGMTTMRRPMAPWKWEKVAREPPSHSRVGGSHMSTPVTKATKKKSAYTQCDRRSVTEKRGTPSFASTSASADRVGSLI